MGEGWCQWNRKRPSYTPRAAGSFVVSPLPDEGEYHPLHFDVLLASLGND